jgi:hypothetical protein
MLADEVRAMAASLGIDDVLNRTRSAYFAEVMRSVQVSPDFPPAPTPIPADVATVLERLALDAEDTGEARRNLFYEAFIARRGAQYEDTEKERLLHFLKISANGILSDRQGELALLLREEAGGLDLSNSAHAWPDLIMLRIARALVLLCRKAGGWADITEAGKEVHALRSLQAEHERSYVFNTDGVAPSAAVAGLIARYNLAKVVDIVAQFTITGTPSDAMVQIRRHSSNIEQVSTLFHDAEFTHISDLVLEASKSLLSNSIWYGTQGLGQKITEFLRGLASENSANPVFDLWPSQRTALTSGLLDPAKRAIVVEMPTSTGKTLIAEFSIIQALALNPASRVAYVVPTRALVNQVTIRLRRDFADLSFVVEAAVPVFEIDPLEENLLNRKIDVLVLTPEKLDLLIRTQNPAVQSLSLVVIDEAHNLQAGERGARLELLLATIKRERASTRFLLLTPFIPNADTIAAWLGDEADSAIKVSWRPSERVTAAASWAKPRNQPRQLNMRTLPSIGNVDVVEEEDFLISSVDSQGSRSVGAVSASITTQLARRGTVLVLARDKTKAEERAAQVANTLSARADRSDLSRAVINFAAAELGDDHLLPSLLQRGVAYHHAGLSHDLRFLIESLIDSGEIDIVCGTTTLAQGVNFPIASVVIESLSVPLLRGSRDLTYSEFWNIAGRAGRAMRDRMGLVVFPVDRKRRLDEVRGFLRGEAKDLVSSLLEALSAISAQAGNLGLGFVRDNRALGVFLQYLTHALRVSGSSVDVGIELEDLLRSSLVYHQANLVDERRAEQLVALARRYLEQIQSRERGYLSLADGTGFSLYSVDMMYAKYREGHPEFADDGFWTDSNLFGDDLRHLSAAIEILSDVPELTLGSEGHGPFSSRRVAGIVRDWVQGSSVNNIADRWFSDTEAGIEKRRRAASHYVHSQLIGQVAWGLGALQKVTLAGSDEQSSNISSLVFYGVPSEEAAALRMAGVPRIAAEGLADRARAGNVSLATLAGIREWLRTRTPGEWAQTLRTDSEITGSQCRRIWSELSGERTS